MAREPELAESVAPGDIAALTRSDEIAFRAVFDGPMPAPRDLYWRGLVYSNFSARHLVSRRLLRRHLRISRCASGLPAAYSPDVSGIEPVSYQVLLEPTQASWLFALDVAMPVAPATSLTRDFRLVSRRTRAHDDPLSRARLIRARRWIRHFRTGCDTAKRDCRTATIRASSRLRSSWQRRNADAGGFLAEALQYIRTEPFFYTLNPPLLSNTDSVDAFWFDSRRGFCSHFAGAFVYLARAVGIPARMIGGYQGGEVNPVTGHLVVRQYDAHAWAEVWLEGRGWVRFDPTAAVAPARIESGLNAALSETDRAVLSAVTGARFDGVPGLRDVLYLFESMQHRWNLWVVGYDTEVQTRYLAEPVGRR